MQFVKRLKLCGAKRVRSQILWLFGTVTFKDGSRLTDNDAISDAKRFFNILDMQILALKGAPPSKRLDRLVFLEPGSLGTNQNINFSIKATDISR